jgi:hypothetical protein
MWNKPTYSLTFPLKLKVETCKILSLVLLSDKSLDGGRKLVGGNGGQGSWLELMAQESETLTVVNFNYYGWDFNIGNF